MKKLFLLDANAQAFSQKEKNLYHLLLFFFFSIYMPHVSWLYNVAMWLVFLYCFLFNSIKEKLVLLKQRKAMLLMALFFLFNCISLLWSSNIDEGVSWIGIRISLLAFPISIGSIYINALLRERLWYAFLVATCAGAIVSIIHASFLAIQQQDLSLLYNDNLSEYVNLQSIYFAMLINLALFGLVSLQVNKSFLVGRYTWLIALIILLPVHFLLASRIAITILYGTILLFAAFVIVYKKMLKQGIMLVAGLLLAAFLLLQLFPKTINRFKELGYTHYNYSSTAPESHFNMALTPEQWNGANLRLAVWSCAWEGIKESFLFGTGIGDTMDELKKQYAAKGFTFGITTNRNVHSTYLDIWISMGLIGLLIFIAGFFILPYMQCIQYRDLYGLLVLTALMLSTISEVYLNRTTGNTILAFFICFIVSCKKAKVKENY
ncbi:MAG: O-antigen ligase family protein [Chitinophagaceae bacterium]